MRSRTTGSVTALVVVATAAAVVALVLTEHVEVAVAVAAAGALLTVWLVAVSRSVRPPADSAARRHNLTLVLRLGHLLLGLGVVALGAGAALTASSGDDGVGRLLLVWIGPLALVSALGMYTGYAATKDQRPDGAAR